MIAKVMKALANPQGALVQALIEQFAKMFKSQKVLEYVEMENELDRAVDGIKIELEALKSVFKGVQEQIDSIKKIAHPPKEFTKDIEDLKNQITDMKTKVSGFTVFFNNMKKLPLLKSIFK